MRGHVRGHGWSGSTFLKDLAGLLASDRSRSAIVSVQSDRGASCNSKLSEGDRTQSENTHTHIWYCTHSHTHAAFVSGRRIGQSQAWSWLKQMALDHALQTPQECVQVKLRRHKPNAMHKVFTSRFNAIKSRKTKTLQLTVKKGSEKTNSSFSIQSF